MEQYVVSAGQQEMEEAQPLEELTRTIQELYKLKELASEVCNKPEFNHKVRSVLKKIEQLTTLPLLIGE